MSTENVSLKKIDLGDYVFLARPCVAVSEEAVKHLAERAVQGKLEFIGVFDDRMDDSVQREVVMSLASSPEISIAIRHVCAGFTAEAFWTHTATEWRHISRGCFLICIYCGWHLHMLIGRCLQPVTCVTELR